MDDDYTMRVSVAQRLRDLLAGSPESRIGERSALLREAADALDSASGQRRAQIDTEDRVEEAEQRIKELEAELFEANQHRVDEAVLGDISRLAETEARLAAAEQRIKTLGGELGGVRSHASRLAGRIGFLEKRLAAAELVVEAAREIAYEVAHRLAIPLADRKDFAAALAAYDSQNLNFSERKEGE